LSTYWSVVVVYKYQAGQGFEGVTEVTLDKARQMYYGNNSRNSSGDNERGPQ